MSKLKKVTKLVVSPMVSMGTIRLRQPLPIKELENVDPFILLHHYGPYAISEFNNPFDLGPHPHRGFEPITLLFKGEQLHRDSLGNESVVKAGDVQWTTAGRGIIHAEAPTKEFVKKGGDLEGIQLWLNLPSDKKMIPPNYQHAKHEDIPVVSTTDKSIVLKIVAGSLGNQHGVIQTQTEVNVFVGKATKGEMDIAIPEHHNALVYLLDGDTVVNNEVLKKNENQLIALTNEGTRIAIKTKEASNFLILSGTPFNEKITQYGPYVMNTQTEILEAMRDYQQGKMGHLY